MTQQLDPNNPIPGTYVFDGRMSRKGYALNKLGNSLLTEEARTAFKADEDAYIDQIGLTAEQKQLVRNRDWLGCVRAGANIYFLIKIAMVLGDSLYKLGAKQKGMTYEEFLATRKVSGAT